MGLLKFMDRDHGLPFDPKRVFWITGWPPYMQRGDHAHRVADQLFVVLRGRVRFSLLTSSGVKGENIFLTPESGALHVPPMTWVQMWAETDDVVLLCLASHEYQDADYVKDWDEWVALVKGR